MFFRDSGKRRSTPASPVLGSCRLLLHLRAFSFLAGVGGGQQVVGGILPATQGQSGLNFNLPFSTPQVKKYHWTSKPILTTEFRPSFSYSINERSTASPPVVFEICPNILPRPLTHFPEREKLRERAPRGPLSRSLWAVQTRIHRPNVLLFSSLKFGGRTHGSG